MTQLSVQLRNRLPGNVNIFEKMEKFSIIDCLKPNKLAISDLAKDFVKNSLEITKIETQWSLLNTVNWEEKLSTELFWVEFFQYWDPSGENPFKELVQLAFRILTLPHSNAEVERPFSVINILKTNSQLG